MQIGRITGLTEPHDWEATGDNTVAITADYQSTVPSDGLFVRDQLLAYPTPDEDVIPVIVTSEPRSSGYYRPLRTTILTDQLSRIHGHIFNYRMDLERVAGFTQPLMESVITGALLTNVNGAVNANARANHVFPSAATDYSLSGVGTASTSFATRASADGALLVNYWTAPFSGVARFTLAPANFYVGAARFEQGSTLRPIVGRNLTQPDFVNWRLSNGCIRITPNAVPGKLDVSAYNGSSWSTPKTWKLDGGGGSIGLLIGFSSVTVLRNSPEEVVIRLGLIWTSPHSGTSSIIGAIGNLDLSLQRGDRVVRGYATSTIAAQMKFVRDTAEAAVALNSPVAGTGIVAAANDGDSNRYFLFSVQAATNTDLVNGGLQLGVTGTSMDLGIGVEIGGTGSVTPDGVTQSSLTYYCAQSEEQRVVIR